MAVLQRVSFLPNERFDTPDARALEAYSLNDWRFFLSGAMTTQSLVLQGFDITNYANIFTVPGFQIQISNVVLFHTQSTTQAAGFYVFAGTEADQNVTLSPNATNFVEADLSVASATPDVRAFWDQGANSGQGGEFTDTINTVINLNVAVTSNISSFTTGKIPLYKVVTDITGVVTSVTDVRPMFFRLGSGGSTPDPSHNYAWPNLPDTAHARMETPITATSATISNAPWQGGDKNIHSFKSWMDAIMSSIKEIKGTPYWYMLGGASGGGVPGVYQNAAMILLSGGTWQHNPPYLTTTGDIQNASNQLINLASTTGIANGDTVTGGGIPAGTTTSAPTGSTVTMSQNATATTTGETVQFRLTTPGHLALSGGANIIRLGLTNNCILTSFANVFLATNNVFYIILPSGDTAVSYGFGQDGTTPISTQTVASFTPTSVTVTTGGNYKTGGGNILLRGQLFAYTAYNAGTGLFSGVSPDPSGVAQAGDKVFQSDSGGVGYYHYSVQSLVPGIASGGVSEGVERTIWLAYFDGVNTIEIRNGDLVPGEQIVVGDDISLNILTYIGSPSESTTNPNYNTSASGSLNTQTNYNSAPGEDLTTRLSKITSMMADKAQDKTLQMVATGYSKLVNTTSGGNQQLTFTGGGTFTLIQTSTSFSATVGLTNTLTLAANQAAYFTINRNASSTIADLSGLTVSAVSAVPLNENVFVFAYRLSGTDVFLWNGQDLPVGTYPTLAQLELEVNQDRNLKLINGGTWAWNSGTSTLSWGSDAQVEIPSLADSVNNIVAGSHTLNDGEVLWVAINRSGAGGNLTVTNTAVASFVPLDENVVIARRTGTDVLIGRSFRLVNGESKLLDAGLSDQNKTFIGISLESDSSPTYSSTSFIANGNSLVTAAGALDARATLQQTIVNQQRSMQLISGGTWAWNATTGALTWSAQANIAIPGLADSVNVIAAGNITLTDGQVATVSYNRTGPGGTLTVSAVAESSAVLSDSIAVIARRVGTTVTIGLHGKMLLQDLESKELGAGLSVQNRTYLGIPTESSTSPAWNTTHAAPLRTIATDSTDVTSAVASIDTQLDKFFGQFRLKPHATLVNRVLVTGVDFTMLDNAVLSQTLSNLVVNFTGSQIDFTTGTVYQSDGVTSLGINFTPFSIPSNQYFWYSVNAVASTVGSDNRISVQMLVLPASAANASPSVAPLAAFTSSGKSVGQVLLQNISGTPTLTTIRQLGVGSGSGSGGTGNVTDIQARMEMKLTDSRYELATIDDFLTNTTSLTSSATATFDVANSRYKFTTVGQNIVSINLFDANEFLTQGVDCGEAEVDLFYLINEVDKTPTVELSRDGGNNYSTVTMTRLGTTDGFNGRLLFPTEGSVSVLHSQLTSTSTVDLSTANQAISQQFTVASGEIITSINAFLNKTGSPQGYLAVQIVKDSVAIPGTPSLLVQDIVAAMTILTANVVNGSNVFALTQSLAPGNYHLVYHPDATYLAAYNGATAAVQVIINGTGSAPFSNAFNVSWSASSFNIKYSISGRALDLRLRITSSATTNWDDPTQAILMGFGVSYNPSVSNITTGIDALEIKQINGNSNTNTFTLTKFLPDWRFLRVYVNETGQVFKYGAFSLNGFQVVFPTNTFNSPNQVYTLSFDQLVGGGFDNTDSNSSLLTANHLGSSDVNIDRSVAGRGIILRRPDGTLRELSINNSDVVVISAVP